MNVLIFGYGLKGGGFYNAMYYLNKGCNVRITDIRDEASLGESASYLKSLGVEIIAQSHRVEDFKWADLVIKTPAVDPDSPFLEYSKNTTTDFACLFSDKHATKVKIICITGTAGKTITCSSVCHCLNKLGKKARMCGNMGISPYAELEKWEKGNTVEYLVCELSSWQLRDTFTYLKDKMPKIQTAVFTNRLEQSSEEQQNIQLYYNDKITQLGRNIKSILCPTEDKVFVAKAAKGIVRSVSSIESNTRGIAKDIPSNMKISYAILKKLGFYSSQINKVIKSFKGVPHRNEFVKQNSNLMIINDSAATIPQAINFTFSNFKGLPVNLICGGTGKNLNASLMLDCLKEAKSITLLDGSFTQNSLIPLLLEQKIKFNGPFVQMQDAVNCALSFVDKKNTGTEVILLSPGSSAFEFYSNEYDRGDKFKACFSK